MQIIFSEDGSAEALQRAVSSQQMSAGVRSLLVFAADDNQWTAEQIDPIVQRSKVPVLGGIFPQIIHRQNHYSQGFVLVALTVELLWAVTEHLSNPDTDYDALLGDLADQWDTLPGPASHLVLVDGLATCIATFIEAVFMNFGLDNPHIGGGAGSLSFEQKPCLLTPNGLLSDVGLIVRLPLASAVGISHGWQAISEPMKVTAAEKNHVQQLEWQPAFEQYRQIVEAHSGQIFTDDNFFDIAKSYPLGIYRLDAELLVRDPLMVQDQGLLCVGEVPEGAFVRVLTGTSDSLIAAAGEAADRACQDWQSQLTSDPGAACFIDCISRVLFLEEKIADEFVRVDKGYPLFGALTLGEIANAGEDYLAFYNKTAVYGLLASDSEV